MDIERNMPLEINLLDLDDPETLNWLKEERRFADELLNSLDSLIGLNIQPLHFTNLGNPILRTENITINPTSVAQVQPK